MTEAVTTITENGNFANVMKHGQTDMNLIKTVSRYIRKEEAIANPFSYWKISDTSNY